MAIDIDGPVKFSAQSGNILFYVSGSSECGQKPANISFLTKKSTSFMARSDKTEIGHGKCLFTDRAKISWNFGLITLEAHSLGNSPQTIILIILISRLSAFQIFLLLDHKVYLSRAIPNENESLRLFWRL